MPPITLNIIGCGRLGKTLARLWHTRGLMKIQGIVNRGLPSALRAADFIGAGRPCRLQELPPADLTMIATGDAVIGDCAVQLAEAGILRPGDIVFHCSGALDADILSVVRQNHALLASCHPVKSFADPAHAVASFAGTYCGIEGDPQATERLASLFETIGGVPLPLRPGCKPLYHASMVMAANYLVTLMACSLSCLEQSGLPSATARKVMEPLVRSTLDNIFALGPADALTGPIARRDVQTVEHHLRALRSWQPDQEVLYRLLGEFTLDLARSRSCAPPLQEMAMEHLLKTGNRLP